MNTFHIIMEQMMLFTLLTLIGVVAVKTKVLNRQALDYFSRYLMRIAIPVLIFNNTIGGATREELIASLSVLLAAAAMFSGLSIFAWGTSRILKLKGNVQRVYRAAFTFGNIGFMGIPLVSVLFPEKGMLYIALFTIVDQSLLWTLGMILTQPVNGMQQKITLKSVLKKMVSPSMMGIVLALLVVLLKIPVPGILRTVMGSIAGTCSPLSMIYIGGLFCYTDLIQSLIKLDFYVMALAKMVLFPVVFFLVMKQFPLPKDILITLTVLAALPEMTTIPMFAESSGSEGEYAVGALMVTTLLSVATLPLIGYLVQIL